jgi:hypothetical protein
LTPAFVVAQDKAIALVYANCRLRFSNGKIEDIGIFIVSVHTVAGLYHETLCCPFDDPAGKGYNDA